MENNKQDPYYITELIIAELTGAITPEQKRELDHWRLRSAENEKLYLRIVDGARLEQYLSKSSEYDYLVYFDALEARVKSIRIKRVLRRVSVAAAILIVVVITSLVSVPRLLDKEGVVAETVAVIESGHSFAYLTLDDGTTVQLNGGKDGTMRIGDAMVVDNDTLRYDNQTATVGTHTLTIPRGSEYFIIMSDGTKIWLNSETRLSYPTAFTAKERRVKIEGEAYFEVSHDASRPFVVESSSQVVTVLGTSFAVRDYPDERTAMTTLESGGVRVTSGDMSANLVPGNQSVTGEGYMNVRKVNTAMYTAWHSGRFVFVDMELGEILSMLSRWYDVEICYAQPKLEKIQLTGELRRYSSINELLSIIETLEKVKFEIKDNTIEVQPF